MIRLDFVTPQDLCSLYHILLNHCVAQKVFKERSKVKYVIANFETTLLMDDPYQYNILN